MISLWDNLQKGPFQTKGSSKNPQTTGNGQKEGSSAWNIITFFQEYHKWKASSRESKFSDLLKEGTDAEEVTYLAWVAHYTFPPSKPQHDWSTLIIEYLYRCRKQNLSYVNSQEWYVIAILSHFNQMFPSD